MERWVRVAEVEEEAQRESKCERLFFFLSSSPAPPPRSLSLSFIYLALQFFARDVGHQVGDAGRVRPRRPRPGRQGERRPAQEAGRREEEGGDGRGGGQEKQGCEGQDGEALAVAEPRARGGMHRGGGGGAG